MTAKTTAEKLAELRVKTEQALDPGLQAEMDRGHGVLLRQALAHLGHSV